ncbi:MAG TPA: hypothetical protein VFV84_12020 [Burkholderiales bacterium]|nr:hypothetical protein [Burkholderiales bacterium]
MSYRLSVEERPGYLHFVVTGPNTRESVEAYLREVAGIAMARRCARMLIEERLEGPRLGTFDVFSIASGGASHLATRFEAIAYVDVNAAGGLMKFMEDVAANRAVPVRVFGGVAEAEQWLEALPPSGAA